MSGGAGGSSSRVSAAARRIAAVLSRALGEAAGLSRPEHRFLAVLAAANRVLEEEGLGRIVVTGGFAVELLAGGATRTLDVDVEASGPEAAEALEEALRLLAEQEGLPWAARGPVLGLRGAEKSIDVLPGPRQRRFPPLRVEVPGYGHVYVEAPEELLLRYLRERLYWGTEESWRRVLLLLGVLWDRLKLRELAEEAAGEDPGLHRLLVEAAELLAERGLLPGWVLEELRRGQRRGGGGGPKP